MVCLEEGKEGVGKNGEAWVRVKLSCRLTDRVEKVDMLVSASSISHDLPILLCREHCYPHCSNLIKTMPGIRPFSSVYDYYLCHVHGIE